MSTALMEPRKHKAEVVALLRGERCRHCGERIDWRAFANVAFADGQAACLPCYEAAEAERQATRGAAAGPTGPRAASVANCRCCRQVRPLTGQGVCGQCAAEGRP
jgi:prepilin-type processing-associated H-X9-DG protein